MTLEQQVVSLELAKKLKELGVKQESLYYWNYSGGEAEREIWRIGSGKAPISGVAAFTVAELDELLPEGTRCYQLANEWFCDYDGYSNRDRKGAVARGKMLIYLIENNLISPNTH